MPGHFVSDNSSAKPQKYSTRTALSSGGEASTVTGASSTTGAPSSVVSSVRMNGAAATNHAANSQAQPALDAGLSTTEQLQRLSNSTGRERDGRKVIKYNPRVQRDYEIGEQVMPSTHRGQEVRFGRRKTDRLPVVIKIREKMLSFKDEVDVLGWSKSMIYLLNLPADFSANVACLIAVEEDDRNYYIVMERVNGRDLFEFSHSRSVKFHDRWDKMRIVQKITRETFTALEAYERHGLTHRDLKLENIVINRPHDLSDEEVRQRQAKGDFGHCKLVDFDTCELTFDPVTNEQVISHDVMGTDQYIAPEAYMGVYSPASDVFAAGVMIYKLVTSKFPFVDELFDDEAGQNYVGHPKMREIRNRLKMAKVDMSYPLLREYPAVKDLVKRCLLFDERRRVKASQALQHPFLCDSLEYHSRASVRERRDSLMEAQPAARALLPAMAPGAELPRGISDQGKPGKPQSPGGPKLNASGVTQTTDGMLSIDRSSVSGLGSNGGFSPKNGEMVKQIPADASDPNSAPARWVLVTSDGKVLETHETRIVKRCSKIKSGVKGEVLDDSTSGSGVRIPEPNSPKSPKSGKK